MALFCARSYTCSYFYSDGSVFVPDHILVASFNLMALFFVPDHILVASPTLMALFLCQIIYLLHLVLL